MPGDQPAGPFAVFDTAPWWPIIIRKSIFAPESN
jgi:hypothetical protein